MLFGNKMRKRNAASCNDAGRDHLDEAQRGAAPLSFVYDFVLADTPFTDLQFLFDAGRAPLIKAGDVFKEKYTTFPQKLVFSDAKMRAPTHIDWFTDIYA